MRFAWLLFAIPTFAIDADVCIYGGTSAGLTAARAASTLRGLVRRNTPSEGLGSSDINNHWFRNDHELGGLALDFYRRIGRVYGKREPVYKFESKIEAWLRESHVTPQREQTLIGVDKRGAQIRSIVTNRASYTCGQYIDATIEGDLLAMAGVRTAVGREANREYNETRNGIRHTNTYRQFEVRVDPYKTPGDRKSGLIATIQDEALGEVGRFRSRQLRDLSPLHCRWGQAVATDGESAERQNR
ncbi:MAG: FAD-dependent oxidoreductase [Acidobacteria bacterium]|nr:FAD-dependent oxidoreductase [Acidobacteriota bacterium]